MARAPLAHRPVSPSARHWRAGCEQGRPRWLDLVFADLEAAEYAVGAVDTCAAGFGAPHIRQRLYWLADADDARSQKWGEPERERVSQRIAGARGVAVGVAYADGGDTSAERKQRGGQQRQLAQDGGIGRMADAADKRHERPRPARGWRDGPSDDCDTLRPGPTNGLWRAADWLGCTDGKWRPVESSPLALADDGTVRDILASGGRASDALTFPLCKAEEYRNRIGLLRGAGNALNVAQAEAHIRAVMGVLDREQAA